MNGFSVSNDLGCGVGYAVGVSDCCDDGADVLYVSSDDVDYGDAEKLFDAFNIEGIAAGSAASWG